MSGERYILTCVNGYWPSDVVIDYGAWFAQKTNKKLKLLHVLDQQYTDESLNLSGAIGLDESDQLLIQIVKIEHEQNKLIAKKGELILNMAKEKAITKGIENPTICLRRGKLVDNCVDIQDNFSMAIIGRYGKKHQEKIHKGEIGHTVQSLVRTLKKPILIVSEEFKKPESILLAFDGSESSYRALEFILSYRKLKEVDIHLVHIGNSDKRVELFLSKATQKLLQKNMKFTINQLEGTIDETLVNYMSENSLDILAMGSTEHGWLYDLLIGSVTSKMLLKTQKPLLLVP